MTMQAATTVGIPVLSPVAATQRVGPVGIHLAPGMNVAVTFAGVIFVWLGLRLRGPRREHRTAALAAAAGLAAVWVSQVVQAHEPAELREGIIGDQTQGGDHEG
jgi:hypothetical protein